MKYVKLGLLQQKAHSKETLFCQGFKMFQSKAFALINRFTKNLTFLK